MRLVDERVLAGRTGGEGEEGQKGVDWRRLRGPGWMRRKCEEVIKCAGQSLDEECRVVLVHMTTVCEFSYPQQSRSKTLQDPCKLSSAGLVWVSV